MTATTVGGLDDSTGEFNQSFVRAINKFKFGQVHPGRRIHGGPDLEGQDRGTQDRQPGPDLHVHRERKVCGPSDTGAAATTDRYPELQIRSSTPGTSTQPLVTVKKTSNTTFSVTYSTNNRSGTTSTLQVYYDKTATPSGKSFGHRQNPVRRTRRR